MPARHLPQSFVALRPLKLGTELFNPGDSVPTELVVSCLGKQLDGYVSRGYLAPDPDQYSKTANRAGTLRHQPTLHLSPTEVNAIR